MLFLLLGTHMFQLLHPTLVSVRQLTEDLNVVLECVKQGLRIKRFLFTLAEGAYTSVGVVGG